MSTFGISAVLRPCQDLDGAVLDLAAVLSGLVGSRFELLLLGDDPGVADSSRARRLPVKVTLNPHAEASYELVLIVADDGQFDVRELNHLLDAIVDGADMAIGYRPRPADGLLRALQRCGWNIEVDCAFALVRRSVWQSLNGVSPSVARRHGYRVAEMPVSNRRPTIGEAVAA